jgi:HNH endonuclease/AP2 domain
MPDEAIIEDVEISEEEPQLIGPEDGEGHETEESDDGFRTTIFVDDGISTPENPGMIYTRAGHLFLIDAEDWPRISGYKWSVSSDGRNSRYVSTRIKGKKIYLHRLLLEAPNDQKVDHRNGDPLDNRKANLRLATHQQNMFNRRKSHTFKGMPTASTFKGVTWERSLGRYKARIKKNGIYHYLGCFDDPRKAALAYDYAALEMFGEYAQTNLTYEDCEEGARQRLGEGHRLDLLYSLASKGVL